MDFIDTAPRKRYALHKAKKEMGLKCKIQSNLQHRDQVQNAIFFTISLLQCASFFYFSCCLFRTCFFRGMNSTSCFENSVYSWIQRPIKIDICAFYEFLFSSNAESPTNILCSHTMHPFIKKAVTLQKTKVFFRMVFPAKVRLFLCNKLVIHLLVINFMELLPGLVKFKVSALNAARIPSSKSFAVMAKRTSISNASRLVKPASISCMFPTLTSPQTIRYA